MDKNQFNKLFGEFIRQKRIAKNWSQSELADKLNNNFQNISRLERGEISPTLYWIDGLAKAFDELLSDIIIEFENYKNQNIEDGDGD